MTYEEIVNIWNEKKEVIGMGAGNIRALHDTICAMVTLQGLPLEEAIRPVTENVAKALHLYPRKGCIREGADADLILLDSNLKIHTVFANGRCMLREGKMQVKPYFEHLH